MKKKLAIYFTGGTISMKYDPEVGAAVPALSGHEIIRNVRGLAEEIDYEIIDFGRFPGPHMTPRRMMELSAQVKATIARDEIAGVVVTHGTDTLEETAYLFDLTISSDKPVVFTGAMRNSSELGYDGPSNILSAARTAASEMARGLGTMVVLNEVILSAAEATKTHTESFDSFQSPEFGPLGVIDKGAVIIRRPRTARFQIPAEAVAEPVFLLKLASGVDRVLIDSCIEAGAKGIVLEALGRGNVPPEIVPGIARALELEIPVVLTSRCLGGRVYQSYGYEGGGKRLLDMGVIFADFLSGQKARIKVMLALGLAGSTDLLRRIFNS
ncbi:MAG: L-asparaginase [Blastocatellia bacterium AA13]|nr:MAG: L-asparaginase [Blastocatellia bacterium AA13]